MLLGIEVQRNSFFHQTSIFYGLLRVSPCARLWGCRSDKAVGMQEWQGGPCPWGSSESSSQADGCQWEAEAKDAQRPHSHSADTSLFLENLLHTLSLILCLGHFLCVIIFCLTKPSSSSRAPLIISSNYSSSNNSCSFSVHLAPVQQKSLSKSGCFFNIILTCPGSHSNGVLTRAHVRLNLI